MNTSDLNATSQIENTNFTMTHQGMLLTKDQINEMMLMNALSLLPLILASGWMLISYLTFLCFNGAKPHRTYEKGLETTPNSFWRTTDAVIDYYFPYFGVTLLNVLSQSCTIPCVVLTYFFWLWIILLYSRFFHERMSPARVKWLKIVPEFIVFLLVANYVIYNRPVIIYH